MSKRERHQEKLAENPLSAKELFYQKYQKLCKEYNMELAASPNFMPRDDGTFSVTIAWSIRQIPKVDNSLNSKV